MALPLFDGMPPPVASIWIVRVGICEVSTVKFGLPEQAPRKKIKKGGEGAMRKVQMLKKMFPPIVQDHQPAARNCAVSTPHHASTTPGQSLLPQIRPSDPPRPQRTKMLNQKLVLVPLNRPDQALASCRPVQPVDQTGDPETGTALGSSGWVREGSSVCSYRWDSEVGWLEVPAVSALETELSGQGSWDVQQGSWAGPSGTELGHYTQPARQVEGGVVPSSGEKKTQGGLGGHRAACLGGSLVACHSRNWDL